MNIRLKATRYEPTPLMVEQVNKKVNALERFIDETSAEASASVELERAVGSKHKGDVWRAELHVVHEGKEFRAESTKTELENAFTTVVRDVARELAREHKKRERIARKGSSIVKSFLQGFGK